MRIKAEPVSTR